MTKNPDDLKLVRNENADRFEITVGTATAFILYQLKDDLTINLYHTEVPSALEGQGVASALVYKTLVYCRENGLKVIASCPFISKYISRHSEWQSILKNKDQ